jgi:hypothetical protein
LKVSREVEELELANHFLKKDISDVSHKLDIAERKLDSFHGEVNDETLRADVEFLINKSGGKPRIDSVENVSIIVQASHDWYEPDGDGNFNPKRVEEFCNAFMGFVEEWKDDSGMTPVRAVLQMDERTPHIHATFVPFDPDGKLNCKYHLGGRDKLAKLHDRFAESMNHLASSAAAIGIVNTSYERATATLRSTPSALNLCVAKSRASITARSMRASCSYKRRLGDGESLDDGQVEQRDDALLWQ